jgi:hypothetical protein
MAFSDLLTAFVNEISNSGFLVTVILHRMITSERH